MMGLMFLLLAHADATTPWVRDLVAHARRPSLARVEVAPRFVPGPPVTEVGAVGPATDALRVLGYAATPALRRQLPAWLLAIESRSPADRVVVTRVTAGVLRALVDTTAPDDRKFRLSLYLARAAQILVATLDSPHRRPGLSAAALDAAVGLRRRITAEYPEGPDGVYTPPRVRLGRELNRLSVAIETALLERCAADLGSSRGGSALD